MPSQKKEMAAHFILKYRKDMLKNGITKNPGEVIEDILPDKKCKVLD